MIIIFDNSTVRTSEGGGFEPWFSSYKTPGNATHLQGS